VIAPSGSLVMYSAALSSVISDSGTDHSLFVGELLKEIRAPDLTAEETLNRTRVSVTRASRGEQVPWISSSLAEDFAFAAGQAKTAAKPEAKTATPIAPPPLVQPKDTAQEVTPAKRPPEPPKQIETSNQPVAKDDAKLLAALADDPTIKTLNGKLAANPKDGNALYRRGQVYASKGAYTLAIKDFDETLKLNPKDVEALNNRCWTRTVIGDLTAASKDCNEALRLRPDFVDALDSRGLLHLKSGQAKSAIKDFDTALKINPRLTSSLYGRGLAKQHDGKSTEGDVDIANAKAMDPNIVKEFAGYGIR
jgi:tetratricopeptide (TPR) repeat protein